jgi:predicted phage-related endonuclease
MTTQINQEMIELHEAGNAWLLAYKEAKQKIKEWTEKADIAQEQIKNMLGDAEIGLINGKESVRWTTVESRRLDVKKAREVLPPQVIDLIEIIQSTRRFTVIEEE